MFGSVSKFVRGGIIDDQRKFESFGVDSQSAEATPYYARWVREDVIGIYRMVDEIRLYARLSVLLLAFVAFALGTIAFRWPTPNWLLNLPNF